MKSGKPIVGVALATTLALGALAPLSISTAVNASASAVAPQATTTTDARTALEKKALAAARKAKGKGKRLVADYNAPARPGETTKYTAKLIPYNSLTDIIHVGISLTASGGLSIPAGFYEKTLVKKAHKAGDHVVLLIGGEFPALSTSSKAVRKSALHKVASWVKKHKYDGVDIDWEFPENATQQKFLVSMFTQLRKELGKKAILSEDVAPWTVDSYEVRKLSKIINWFNVMTYDCAGSWTGHGQLNEPILKVPSDPAGDECTPGQSDEESVQVMLAAGAKRKQLNQGTPFYGYWYKTVSSLYGACPEAATSADKTCGDAVVSTVGYGADIVPMLASGEWQVYRDPEGLVPYLLRKDGTPGFVTYDDPLSTYDRVLYSDWVQKLGGTFMWALELGYTKTGSQPLVAAMHRATYGKKLS
jgi:chitinase